MQRHHYHNRGGPFLGRPGLPPFGRSGLLGELLIGGLGYLLGRQQGQNQSPATGQRTKRSACPAQVARTTARIRRFD